jgi:hypothetical protein
MTEESKARAAARRPNGRFGLQAQSLPDITVNTGPDTADVWWSVELEYNDGLIELIVVDACGKLRTPHRSDRRTLITLVGFKDRPFSPAITMTLTEALSDPGSITGFCPVFDTTDDSTTTVFGLVKSFIEL